MGTIIYTLLFIMGMTMLFMMTIRLLFLNANKEADRLALRSCVEHLRQGSAIPAAARLGWLQPFVVKAGSDPIALRTAIERFERRVTHFHHTLVVVANAAMGVGFLGSVASMASLVGGKVDPVVIIGLGMQSTMTGLIIALPGTILHGLTDERVNRLLDQVELISDAIDSHICAETTRRKTKPAAESSYQRQRIIRSTRTTVACGERQRDGKP